MSKTALHFHHAPHHLQHPLPPLAIPRKKNTFSQTTSTSSRLSKNSPSDITVKTCNTGRELSCETCVARMIAVVGYVNVHITNAVNGRSSQGNLPNVGDAGGRNTAAKNAKRVLGCSTDIGVLQRHSSLPSGTSALTTMKNNERIWLEVGPRSTKERTTFLI